MRLRCFHTLSKERSHPSANYPLNLSPFSGSASRFSPTWVFEKFATPASFTLSCPEPPFPLSAQFSSLFSSSFSSPYHITPRLFLCGPGPLPPSLNPSFFSSLPLPSIILCGTGGLTLRLDYRNFLSRPCSVAWGNDIRLRFLSWASFLCGNLSPANTYLPSPTAYSFIGRVYTWHHNCNSFFLHPPSTPP